MLDRSPKFLMPLCAMLGLTILIAAGCLRDTPGIVVITATFLPPTPTDWLFPTEAAALPTSGPTAEVAALPTLVSSADYVVQPGDTLMQIATRFGTSVEALIASNQIVNPDSLLVGQSLIIPAVRAVQGPSNRWLPDRRLVRSPGAAELNVSEFINAQDGALKTLTDEVDGIALTAAGVIQRAALEFSVDPRILLALLEYRGGWLTRRIPLMTSESPLGAPAYTNGIARDGLYLQVSWAADRLNAGYYGWQAGTLQSVGLTDGTRVQLAPELNAGTAAVQSMLAAVLTENEWTRAVSDDGLKARYEQLFGSTQEADWSAPVPENMQQPALALPFAPGDTWYFTGGPHGGWGSGSAWAAVDFAPPDDITLVDSSCYVSDYFAVAASDGVIARTDEGTVILDLDGDGDESTGWSLLYLHIAQRDRVEAGQTVRAGDRIGRPSCEGGFSNGTHLHLARRYNGEWIPADCPNCRPERPRLSLGGWTAQGLPGQEYQGTFSDGERTVIAEQRRNIVDNRLP